MRNAETVLTIVRERGTRGLPLEDVYRMLYNPDLYLRAYGRLYKNEGAMTKGTTDETVDGMELPKIEKLIDDVRNARHRWTPVRRVYIPKKKGRSKTFRVAHLEGQDFAGSHALHSGSVLRTADEQSFSRVSPWTWMSHSPTRDSGQMDWLSLVCGGRHRQVFRHHES